MIGLYVCLMYVFLFCFFCLFLYSLLYLILIFVGAQFSGFLGMMQAWILLNHDCIEQFFFSICIITLLFIHTWCESYSCLNTKRKMKHFYVKWYTYSLLNICIFHTTTWRSLDVSANLTNPESIYSWKWTLFCNFAFGIFNNRPVHFFVSVYTLH